MRGGSIGCLACAVASLLAVGATLAQFSSDSPFGEALPGSAPAVSVPKPPAMAFAQLAEVVLPGPLGGEPWIEASAVRVPVGGGLAVVAIDAEPAARILEGESARGPVAEQGAVETADGRRFVPLAEGGIAAERRREGRQDRWKRLWRLRIPGDRVALPVVSGERLYFGALDNRVYCVRARNGHRIWTTALPGRIDRPLAVWRGLAPEPAAGGEPSLPLPRELELVLAVPEGAPRVLALDARDGRQVARLELPEERGHLVGAPLVTPDSRIVVAWQNYDESRAALIFFELRRATEEVDTALSAAAAGPARP